MKADNRKFSRRCIDLTIQIELADGSTAPGTLLDLSESGVRLKVRRPDNLPEQFLVKLTSRLERWARVVWRSAEEVGLEFLAVPQTSAEAAPKHAVLIRCPKTGRNISTGVRLTAADDLTKLSRARRFTQCPCCKAVHSWLPSDAMLAAPPSPGSVAC
jgi:PilZ domain